MGNITKFQPGFSVFSSIKKNCYSVFEYFKLLAYQNSGSWKCLMLVLPKASNESDRIGKPFQYCIKKKKKKKKTLNKFPQHYDVNQPSQKYRIKWKILMFNGMA